MAGQMKEGETTGTCNTGRKIRNAYTIFILKSVGSHLGDLGVKWENTLSNIS
jgi:hypothetical protein